MIRILGYLTGACLAMFFAFAATSAEPLTQKEAYIEALRPVAAPELPARAAEIISKTDPADQEAVTISVIEAVLSLRPAAAPAVVGAIIRANPDMARVALNTAVRLQPKQEAAIRRAVVSAMRVETRQAGQARPEVAARTTEGRNPNPGQATVAPGTAAAAPGDDHALEIIGQALTLQSGPVQGPPFTELVGEPNEITPAQTQELPPGTGHRYSSP